MKLNRRRTAITFIGIVFMVILMTCVFAGKRTVLAYLNKVAALDKGNWFVAAYDLTPEETLKIRDMEETTVMGCSEQLGILEFPQTGNDEEKPYLDVKAYSSESFEMVNIELTEGRFPENKNEIIMLSSGNRLGYSKNPRTLHTFRCHFEVPASSGEQMARSFVMDFGGEETGIETTDYTNYSDAWYTIDGRKLDSVPTKKGLYIHKGKKVVKK